MCLYVAAFAWVFPCRNSGFSELFLIEETLYFQMESDISQQEIIKTLQTQLTNAREDLQQKVFPLHTL